MPAAQSRTKSSYGFTAAPMKSMAIRIMPSTAHVEERVAGRRAGALTGMRSAGSDVSKTSTLRWREGVQQQPYRRCLTSATTAVMVSVAVLVASSVVAIWVPSANLADEELRRASEDQLLSSVEMVSKELLGYLQVASSQAAVVGSIYNMSFAAAPTAAPQQYMEEFGPATWGLLRQKALLSSVLVAQARDPLLVNGSSDPSCDTDVALVSATYKANLNSQTTGTGLVVDETELALVDTDEAPAGKARMNNIRGAEDLSDPLAFESLKFFKSCDQWLGGGEKLWEMQNLPGSWPERDSGVREVTWLPGTVTAGSGAAQALYKKVFFPLEGPSWADRSAFGAVSIRVGSRTIDDSGSLGMLDILQQVSAQTDTLLFMLTAEAELLATSEAGQQVERVDENNNILGLLPADSGLVEQPIGPVAAELVRMHCSTDASGTKECDWASVQRLQKIMGYFVACKFITDPQATNLNMLLVNMVSTEEIMKPTEELNIQLSITGGSIFAGTCLLALVLSRVIIVPFRRARDSMFLIGDMKVEDALAQNDEQQGCRRWSFTEASDLRLSFFHAAKCLKAWREHEMDRRAQLQEELANRTQKTVERAVRGAGKLVHPMVLISAEAFSNLEQLTSYEELRDTGKLVFLDTEESLATFKADHSIVFLSHQWLAWGFPDNSTKTHLNAMKSAIRSAAGHMAGGATGRCSWDNLYVWVDYASIAQDHRGMQMLAVSSLPVYASSADVFVIVAPPAEHQSCRRCDLDSYNARGWCRAEMLAKICSSGLENFFIFAHEGGLERVTEERLPSLSMFVFEGEFSCCQQRHARSGCDKEALVEPVLGLYSLVLRHARAGVNIAHMGPVLRHIRQNKERFFPSTHAYVGEGGVSAQRELFGSLVDSTEQYVQDLSIAECAVSFDSSVRPALTSRTRTSKSA